MVPAYSTKIDESLGKLTGLGVILWNEVNQRGDDTICSLTDEDIEQVKMEEDIPEWMVEMELETGEVWTWLALAGGETTDDAGSKFTCCKIYIPLICELIWFDLIWLMNQCQIHLNQD